MFIPGRFQPSQLTRHVSFDAEGRLYEGRLGSMESGIGDANSIYATDAERFDAITPFLKKNKAAADAERGWVVQPGGAILECEDQKSLKGVELPDPRTSFGHNSQQGTKLVDQKGRSFTLGRGG